jgi:hypothetical protein
MKPIKNLILLALLAMPGAVTAQTLNYPSTAAGKLWLAVEGAVTNPVATPVTNVPASPLVNTNLTVGSELALAVETLFISTNMLWEAHAMYAPELAHHAGGGIGGYYLLSQTGSGTVTLDTYTGVRIDWVDGGFWMPEGNVGLQVPVKLENWLTVTPFTYVGVGVPLSGASIGGFTIGGTVANDNDGQITGIVGAGGAIQFFSFDSGKWNAGALGDAEKWGGFSGTQFRFGAFLRKKF